MLKYYKNINATSCYYKLEGNCIWMRYAPFNWFLTTMLIETLELRIKQGRIIEITEEELFDALL